MRNFEPNKYILKKDYCLIELKTYKDIKYTKISLEDIEHCKKYKWRFYKDKNKFYVRANYRNSFNKRCMISLHRYLLEPKEKEFVDHINGDSLDNRRENLRIADPQLNCLNRIDTRRSSTGIKYIYEISDGHKQYYTLLVKRFGYVIFSKYLSKSEQNLEILKNMIPEVINYINKDTPLFDPTIVTSEDIIYNIQKHLNRIKGKTKQITGYAAFCDKIKRLDNFQCCGCGEDFSANPEKLEVHHIITRAERPDLIRDENNCISLCKECHYSIKSREDQIEPLLKYIIKFRK